MQKHDELLKEFETEFEQMKNELNFKATLEELDEIFFLRDYVLQSGFVSKKLSRGICARIRDTYISIIQLIQNWLSPSPYSFISITESNIFNEKEKEELNTILRDFLGFVSENAVIGIVKDKNREAQYIDNSLDIWSRHSKQIAKYLEKVHIHWKSPEVKQKREIN